MLVQDIMTANPEYLMGDATAVQAARKMRMLDVGMLPVIDTPKSMRLIGLVTDRDLVARCLAEGHGGLCDVASHMSPQPLVTVTPTAEARTAVEAMAHHQVRRLPVVLDGRLVGVVTQGDAARRLGPTDPELVEWMLERISHPGALVATG